MTKTGVGALIALAMPVVVTPALAQAAASVQTAGSASIEQPATISTSRDLMFAVAAASVAVVPSLAAAAPTSSSSGSSTRRVDTAALLRTASSVGSVVPSAVQATFVVAGDSGQAISVVVPQAVALNREGGTGTALLATTDSLGDGPQFLGGDFSSGGTLSFNVGGQVVLASADVAGGTYDGVMAVVAQYN